MKKVKKIKEVGGNIREALFYAIRRLCLRPSPGKRLIAVVFFMAVLAIANSCFLINSIYSIGRRNGQKELLRLQHIETLPLPYKKDSAAVIINYELTINNEEYEHEQSTRE